MYNITQLRDRHNEQTVEVINQLCIETGAEVNECRKALEQGNQNKDEH
jgi:hypothetical protein